MKVVRRPLIALLVLLLVATAGYGVYWYRSSFQPIVVDHVPMDSVPAPPIDISQPGVTALQALPWAEKWGPRMRIQPRALAAYANAEQTMRATTPGCHLQWSTLAGLAYIESNHGRHEGSRIASDGKVSSLIRGPRLDGSQQTENIPDTDQGRLDGDSEYDVAMGPFQFIPQTWAHFGVDANGDGVADPDNIDDAAVTAARYLCQDGHDLADVRQWSAAIYSYNHSVAYVKQVFAAADAYAQGRAPRWTIRNLI